MISRKLITSALLTRNVAKINNFKPPHRNSGDGVWTYRGPGPEPSKRSLILAQVLGGICWWWMLYHIAIEPEHLYGEFTYIHPETYTDEELGIPPDSAGPLAKL